MGVKGRIHSYETFTTSDGPGIRFILFTQGCKNNCIYCHNPDTWEEYSLNERDSDDIIKEYKKYEDYYNFSNGGITISGGEPLLQPDFLLELFIKLKENKINIALDTAGSPIDEKIKKIIDLTDLVIFDVKSTDEETLKKICKIDVNNIFNFMEYTTTQNKRIWVRNVLVPEFTENINCYEKLADFLSKYADKIERVEFLKFHQLGKKKWENLNRNYPLKDSPQSVGKDVEVIKEIFKKVGINNVIFR